MKGDALNVALALVKTDGTKLTRIEMEQQIREVLKSAMAKRNKAISEYGLPQKEGLSMKPIPLLHWLLDAMIDRGEILGDKIGIQPQDDFDPKSEAEFVQRLWAFVQAGQAIPPKEGEMPNMSQNPQYPAPPALPGATNGQSYPPPPAPPTQQGWAPPPPPPAPSANPQQSAPPSYGPPPGYQPPAQQGQQFAPPAPPAQFATPPAPPQAQAPQGQPGFAPPPPPPAPPQESAPGAPPSARGRRGSGGKAAAPPPPPPPPGAPQQQQMQFQAPPPPAVAPQFPQAGNAMFNPPAAAPQFAPQAAPVAQAPAPQASDSQVLTKVQQDIESVRAQMSQLQNQVVSLQNSNKLLETALVYFMRGMMGKAGANTFQAVLSDCGVTIPS